MAHGKEIVDEKYHLNRYNTVINIDSFAEQSIRDLHIQLIPYYEGDVENPKGGIPAALFLTTSSTVSLPIKPREHAAGSH